MKEREKTVFAILFSILAILMILVLVFGPLKRSDQEIHTQVDKIHPEISFKHELLNEIMLIKIKNIENKLDSLIKN